MSRRRGGRDLWSRVGFGALLLVVLVLVLVVRPGGSGDDPAPGADAPATSPSAPGPTGSPASEEEFCRAFRELAGAQTVYAAAPDTRGAELLREATDALLALGPPASMSRGARGGLFTLVRGVYGSLGEDLPRSAVPGAADRRQAVGRAFDAWLSDYCPA